MSTKFKFMHGDFAPEAVFRSGGQLIPATRRVTYSAFLAASPRIMEPIFLAEV